MSGKADYVRSQGQTHRLAVLPCERDTIIKEYVDGQMAVRIRVASEDVERFWTAFPELNEAAYLSCEAGAIEAIRGPVEREYRDGALTFRLLIEPKDKLRFRELWPRPGSDALLAREDPSCGRSMMQKAASEANPEPEYGNYARVLRTSVKFMGALDIWRELGTDEDYQKFLRTLPCAHCRWTPHWENDVFVPCEPAHVRRIASGAGTSIKPAYSAIPLCPAGHGKSCHRAQHQQGEGYLGGKERVDKLRMYYVHAWVWVTLKAKLGYEHMNQVPPEALIAWADEHAVLHCLPPIYLQAA